jgi:hypothetical protein
MLLIPIKCVHELAELTVSFNKAVHNITTVFQRFLFRDCFPALFIIQDVCLQPDQEITPIIMAHLARLDITPLAIALLVLVRFILCASL